MRKKIVAGNWKMNLNLQESTDLVNELKAVAHNATCEVIVAPSYVMLYPIKQVLEGSAIQVAAQNVNEHDKGAFTGEVSVDMLSSLGIDSVIIGHSERRDVYKETDELLAEKTAQALSNNFQVIFCVGEHLKERKTDQHFKTVQDQLERGLFSVKDIQWDKVVIAYEPVWAIGTGETASPEQAQEMHAYIRKAVVESYGKDVAAAVRILYGGSVKPDNAGTLFQQPDVDGGLVGGAALSAESFIGIIKNA